MRHLGCEGTAPLSFFWQDRHDGSWASRWRCVRCDCCLFLVRVHTPGGGGKGRGEAERHHRQHKHSRHEHVPQGAPGHRALLFSVVARLLSSSTDVTRTFNHMPCPAVSFVCTKRKTMPACALLAAAVCLVKPHLVSRPVFLHRNGAAEGVECLGSRVLQLGSHFLPRHCF